MDDLCTPYEWDGGSHQCEEGWVDLYCDECGTDKCTHMLEFLPKTCKHIDPETGEVL